MELLVCWERQGLGWASGSSSFSRHFSSGAGIFFKVRGSTGSGGGFGRDSRGTGWLSVSGKTTSMPSNTRTSPKRSMRYLF